MRNTKVLTLSIPPEMANEVEAVAKAENRTRSELLREAFRQYIENKKWGELQKEAALRAQRLGITSAERLEEAIDQVKNPDHSPQKRGVCKEKRRFFTTEVTEE